MKIPAICCLVFATCLSGNAQSQSNTTQTQTEQIAEARRRVIGPPGITRLDSAAVNVLMLGSKTLPLVEARLNGKGPYRLLVDSARRVKAAGSQAGRVEQTGLSYEHSNRQRSFPGCGRWSQSLG